VLTSKETGEDNAITITVQDDDGNNTDTGGLSRLAYDVSDADPASHTTNLTQVNAAQNAQITIDGTLTVSTSNTNEFSNVIDGVDITAKKLHATDDDLSDISVTENNNNIKTGLNSFISSYNELLELSNKLGASSEAGAGVMAGDSLLRGVMSKLRSEITNPVDLGGGNSLSLSQLGVETDRYGVLTLNTETLNEKIASDVDLVQQFFVGDDDDGFAQSFDEKLSFYTDSDGIIQNRIDSKTNQLDDIDDQRLDLASKMESLSDRLYAQYNAMDLLVANLNSTSSYIQAQLDNMPGVVRQSK